MKNILVPIDFSPVTSRVLKLGRELAKAFDARIHLIHVRQIIAPLPANPLAYGGLGMPEIISVPVPEVIGQPAPPNDKEDSKLEEWKKEIDRTGLEVTVHKPTGDVVEEILECARKAKVDAIVMGRHGHGAMYELLVGSVTEGVLKRATCSVVLVPSAEGKS